MAAKGQKLREPAPSEAWEKLPEETATAFGAFREYLLLGPDRSLAKVGRILGKRKQTLEPWSVKFRWVARAGAFDAALAKTQDEAMLDELEQRGRDVAGLMVDIATALAKPAEVLARRIEKDEALLDEVDPEELVRISATAARALPRLYAAERLARGQSTTNVGGARGGPLEVEDRRRAAAEERVQGMNTEAIENLLAGAAKAKATEKPKRKRKAAKRKASK